MVLTRLALGVALATVCGLFGAEAKAADGAPFAATGLSTKASVMEAAEEATRAMMDKFAAAGRKPGAVIFLERVADAGKFRAQYQQIGDKVKQLAGGVPTFGHGGTEPYGIVLGPELKDGQSSFLVIGLDAPGLDVKGYAVGGSIEYSYPDAKKPDDPAKVQQWEQAIAREKVLRATCQARGHDLGAMIPKMEKPGFILVLGALHNDWHVTFIDGIREAAGANAPIVGGVGRWEDYVYNNGQPLKTRDGKDTAIGQLAVVIQGDMQVALTGMLCKDTYKRPQAESAIGQAAAKSIQSLGGKKPAVVFAFSCVTILRNTKVNDPGVYYEFLRKIYGPDTAIFGCFCGGEIGTDNDGAASAGGDRFMVAALGQK